jgi:heptosyltransferase-2
MRVLIVKLGALGDVVMASSQIQALRQQHPQARITWLCGMGVAPLVRQFQGVDEILTVDDALLFKGSLLQKLRGVLGAWGQLAFRSFDRIAIGHHDPRYRVLAWPARSPMRRSFDKSLPMPGQWHGQAYAHLIADLNAEESAGLSLAALKRALPSPAPGRMRVTLVPGGAKNLMRDDGLRRWPLTHYAALAKALGEHGCHVALCGSASDAWVLPAFQGLAIEDQIGKTDLDGLLDLLSSSHLVVTHDTGPMHLAGLAKARTLALFGPTRPDEKVLPGGTVQALWGGASLACRPCYDGRDYAPCSDNQCLATLSPGQVLAQALKMLSEHHARG